MGPKLPGETTSRQLSDHKKTQCLQIVIYKKLNFGEEYTPIPLWLNNLRLPTLCVDGALCISLHGLYASQTMVPTLLVPFLRADLVIFHLKLFTFVASAWPLV